MGRARRERGSSSRLRRTSPNGLLISVEKSLPLNNVFTLAIFIHWGGGDEEMYIVETLAKNRRLYPREGKDVKRLAGIEEIEGERQEAHTWGRDKPAL